jgi:ADP-ribosylglycohydrolase
MPDELSRCFLPVVVAARVGDAMGEPTEGLEPGEIKDRFGWVDEFSGDGTDDSLMATMLADAMVATDGYAGVDDWAAQWSRQRDLIEAKKNKFFLSVRHSVQKAAYGWAPRRVAAGNMPSSSSAMAIWPVGLINAGRPREAAAQAYSLAALVHVGEVDFCQDAAAAIAAAVAAGLRPGTSVRLACAAGLQALHPVSGRLMAGLIAGAVTLAEESSGYDEFRESYHGAYRQSIVCDARETVPAAFALSVLAHGEPKRAVEYGANFGRDTDTIASMAGALCGATDSAGPLPQAWLDRLGPQALRSAADLAERLAAAARAKAAQYLAGLDAVPGFGPVRG